MRLLLFWLALAGNPAVQVADIEGVVRQPLMVQKGKEAVLFFVTNDCPISNGYAHEIARICADYRSQGAQCALVYVDPSLTDAAAKAHAAQFGHGEYPKLVDRHHDLVRATGATVTPEAVVVNGRHEIIYRGRIDDGYPGLGHSRREPTSRDLRLALDATLAGRPAPQIETKPIGCYIPDVKVFTSQP